MMQTPRSDGCPSLSLVADLLKAFLMVLLRCYLWLLNAFLAAYQHPRAGGVVWMGTVSNPAAGGEAAMGGLGRRALAWPAADQC